MFRGDANRRTWVLLAVIWVEARAAVAWTDGTRGATLAHVFAIAICALAVVDR